MTFSFLMTNSIILSSSAIQRAQKTAIMISYTIMIQALFYFIVLFLKLIAKRKGLRKCCFNALFMKDFLTMSFVKSIPCAVETDVFCGPDSIK